MEGYERLIDAIYGSCYGAPRSIPINEPLARWIDGMLKEELDETKYQVLALGFELEGNGPHCNRQIADKLGIPIRRVNQLRKMAIKNIREGPGVKYNLLALAQTTTEAAEQWIAHAMISKSNKEIEQGTAAED
jgi:DNA-directed RNA polymerase sigma subunit (sigma70/sigma32)